MIRWAGCWLDGNKGTEKADRKERESFKHKT
jgi:hypothetical protein